MRQILKLVAIQEVSHKDLEVNREMLKQVAGLSMHDKCTHLLVRSDDDAANDDDDGCNARA